MKKPMKVKRGLEKVITFTLTDADGNPVAIPDGYSVFFTIKRRNEVPVLNLGECVILDQEATPGAVTYLLTKETSNALVANEYYAEFCTVSPLNRREFYPNSDTPEKDYVRLKVSDSLAQPE